MADDTPAEGRQQRRYVYQGNPKAAGRYFDRRDARPRLELPSKRLGRLGADELDLAVFGALWRDLPDDDARRDLLDTLGRLTDDDLAGLLDELEAVPAMNANEVDKWVRAAPHRRLAAGLALTIEHARDDGPRESLVRRLEVIR